jgi:hypothetical protein
MYSWIVNAIKVVRGADQTSKEGIRAHGTSVVGSIDG